MKPRKLVGELKERAGQMLRDGKKRGEVCKELGISYLQLSREFGNVWKQTGKTLVAVDPMEPK